MQDAPLLEGTIRSNLRLGRHDATETQMWSALATASADHFVAEMDDGLDSAVGSRGRRLSGGQQGRLGVARALLRNATILILDEPTAGLDAETANRLLDDVLNQADGHTVVLVTHDESVARRAARVLTLDHGVLVENAILAHDPFRTRRRPGPSGPVDGRGRPAPAGSSAYRPTSRSTKILEKAISPATRPPARSCTTAASRRRPSGRSPRRAARPGARRWRLLALSDHRLPCFMNLSASSRL